MAMTFEEYEEKHLHDLNHEARRLVRMGWNARASHGNCQGILDSSGHIADARKMVVSLKPIAESKVRQLGGDVCGVLVRKDEKLAAVDEHGRVRWLDSWGGADRAQGGQGADVVAWECSGEPGLYDNITRSKGEADHHRKIGRTVRPLVYGDTQPQPAVPEAYILRKQAEAIEAATKACEIKSATDDSRCYSIALMDYADGLKRKADEAERAGGEHG